MLCWNYDLDRNAIMQMMRLALRSPAGRMPRARLVPPLASAGALLLLSFFWQQWGWPNWNGSAWQMQWVAFRVVFSVLYVAGAWRAAREGILRLEMKAMRKSSQPAPVPGTHRVTVFEGVYTHEGDLGSGTAQTVQYMKEEIRCVVAGKAGLLVVFSGDGFDFIPAYAFQPGETPRSSRQRLLAALAGEAALGAADASAWEMPQDTQEMFSAETASAQGTREMFSAETAYAQDTREMFSAKAVSAQRTGWTYRIEREEVGQMLDESQRAQLRSVEWWKRQWLFVIFLLFFLAQMGRMYITSALNGQWGFLIISLLMITIWACLARAMIKRQHTNANPRLDRYSGEYTLRLEPASLVIEAEGGSLRIRYGSVRSLLETAHYFVLVYTEEQGKIGNTVFPKHAFTAAEQDELRQQLHARCPGIRGREK